MNSGIYRWIVGLSNYIDWKISGWTRQIAPAPVRSVIPSPQVTMLRRVRTIKASLPFFSLSAAHLADWRRMLFRVRIHTWRPHEEVDFHIIDIVGYRNQWPRCECAGCPAPGQSPFARGSGTILPSQRH